VFHIARPVFFVRVCIPKCVGPIRGRKVASRVERLQISGNLRVDFNN